VKHFLFGKSRRAGERALRYTVLLAILLPAMPVRAQIALDAQSSYQTSSAGSSFTWNHTCTGSNLVLVVGVQVHYPVGITSVTYNGVAMTLIGTVQDPDGGEDQGLYYLAGPATGTNAVVVNLGSSLTFALGGAVSLTGVSQSTALDATNQVGYLSTTSPSVNIVTVASGAWVVDEIDEAQNNLIFSPVSPQNSAWFSGQYTNLQGGMSYYGPISPAGSFTDGWSVTTGAPLNGGIIVASFAPASGGATVRYCHGHP
jgi:hypothetical protein